MTHFHKGTKLSSGPQIVHKYIHVPVREYIEMILIKFHHVSHKWLQWSSNDQSEYFKKSKEASNYEYKHFLKDSSLSVQPMRNWKTPSHFKTKANNSPS